MLNRKVLLVHYESYQEVCLQVSLQHKPSSVPIRSEFKGRLSYLHPISEGGEQCAQGWQFYFGPRKLAELERMHEVRASVWRIEMKALSVLFDALTFLKKKILVASLTSDAAK